MKFEILATREAAPIRAYINAPTAYAAVERLMRLVAGLSIISVAPSSIVGEYILENNNVS